MFEKNDHNEHWIVYNYVEQKMSWGKSNEPPLTKEGNTVYLGGLKRHWIPSTKSDTGFR